MPLITDYNSLSQAIADYTHRSDLYSPSGGTFLTDYFLQSAQEMINKDIFDKNFGNGISFMEAAYGPAVIAGGTTYLPTGYIAPKLFKIANSGGTVSTLIPKAATWIYDRYPIRQATGLPAYIARDLQGAVSFTGVLAAGVLTASAVTGVFQTGNLLAGTGLPTQASSVTITAQLTGTTGGAGTYSVSNTTLSVTSQAMTAGGNVFVFGPYPDSGYTVSGTFYQIAPLLNATQTTNWMVLNVPNTFFAAAMMKAMLFLRDTEGLELWNGVYQGEIQQLINQDKAERWGSATMQIEQG